jgi:glycosyltransferase involved in cell wall biosynthesis
MKIVIVLSSLATGGAERATVTLASYWAGLGWKVTLVTFAPKEMDFYCCPDSVQRLDLGLYAPSGSILSGALANVRRIVSLRRLLRSIEADVVVSMMDQTNVVLAAASVLLRSGATVGMEHSYPPMSPLRFIWGVLRKTLYRQLDAVVVLTQESAEWISRKTFARRVEVIPNAVVWPLQDSPPFVSPPAVGGDGKTLLAVGRLGPEKQHALLIDVFSRFAHSFPDWKLVILGEGGERATLEQMVRARGLVGRVLLPGRAGNVGSWYSQADLFVLCSRYEGMPISLIEAMGYGMPVVSFDCLTGPRDVIRDGTDGVLVPPNDTEALKAALEGLMRDPERRAAMGQRARAVVDRFDIVTVSGRWEQLFREIRSAVDIESDRRRAGS